MITITTKTRSGQIADIHVEEVISIDGRPYEPEDGDQDILDRLARLEGAIELLLTINHQPA